MRSSVEAAESHPPADVVTRFASDLLVGIGVRADIAAVVAEILVEGDLLGHHTHGLRLLPRYLAEIESGSMNPSGDPAEVSRVHGNAVWDGLRLPGPWVVRQGLTAAIELAAAFGVGTVVVRRSHHIACLAAYLRQATDIGLVPLIATSDPNSALVAPHGGSSAVLTPNPIAAGIPSSGDPILVDISTSMTSKNEASRRQQARDPFPNDCLVDAQGLPSKDPSVLFDDPPGAILPLGGSEQGHKGFGLGLIVEALTGGLAGSGRADQPEGWGATVFIQVIDPAAFAGTNPFKRQVDWIARACHRSLPQQGRPAVRLPGEAGLRRRRQQLSAGVEIDRHTWHALTDRARKLGIPPPTWST